MTPHTAGDSIILSSGICPVHLCSSVLQISYLIFESEYAFQSLVAYNSSNLGCVFEGGKII